MYNRTIVTIRLDNLLLQYNINDDRNAGVYIRAYICIDNALWINYTSN